MNVAIIEPVGGHGGMDYYDYGLAYGLGSNGVNVIYYTCDKTTIRHFENVDTVLLFKNLWVSNVIIKAFRYLKGHFIAFKDVKKKGIAIVHLHFFTFRFIDYLILKLAHNMKLTVVATIHDVNSLDKRAKFFIEKKCYKLIDGVILHNEFSKADFLEKKLPVKNITIIPHGNYKPFIKELLPNGKNTIFTLLFFGQIKKAKGLDILIKAIRIVKEKGYSIKLVIAGKAWKDDLDYYIKLISDLCLNDDIETHFRYIPDNEVSSFYSRADLVVLPYTEIYQSGALLLAMSYSKPILCSDLAAFKEIIVEEETGFLFQSQNEKDLARKILYIIENPEKYSTVIENANLLIESKYDWKRIGRDTRDFYLLNQ